VARACPVIAERVSRIAGEFAVRFGRTPCVYRAPGRVNLIGEHTDYNDGFVMPMALDRCTWVAAAARADRRIVVHSREYAETVTIDAEARWGGPTGHWSDYVRGVASELAVSGADMLVASDVPIGAGLSSSAALEVGVGYALLDLARTRDGQINGRDEIDRTALALACQRAEHKYGGTRCGVMDQIIACHGCAGCALMLDTRTLSFQSLPLPAQARIVVCNTMVRHELAAGEYNERRADCESGVRVLAGRYRGVRALRDATLEQLDAVHASMPDRIFRRCRHVVTENARVERAARALADDDLPVFGTLMRESHYSLRDDFEVSCRELDALVTIAERVDGLYGARMTGGGFGGCAIALVDAEMAARAAEEIARGYEREVSRPPDVWMCAAGRGVERL
jgi:galactokinase